MNIIEYIKKYGRLDYEQLEFNNVDRLILSQFSYLKFDGLLPEVGEQKPWITIGQLAKHPDIDHLFADERYEKNNRALFFAMAEHPRFSLIRLNYYISLTDEKWELQFSALTAQLPDDHYHVIFRGTDDSIIGWKEDLNMTFMTPIPAQEKAVDYINYVAPLIEGDFSVGGHSKGGNLAVYASMKCSEDIKARISRIDNHDGPGFTAKVLQDSGYEEIRSRIHKLVPHSSMVGMLLTSVEDYDVVMCKNFGILQHDPFNWIVVGTDFVYRNEVAGRMMVRNSSINKWADKLTDEECRALSDGVYETFERAGITNLNDIYSNPAKALKNLLEATDELDEDKRELVGNILMMLHECIVTETRLYFEDIKDETAAQVDKFIEETKLQFDNIKEAASRQIDSLMEEAKNLTQQIKDAIPAGTDISDKSVSDEQDRTDRTDT